MPKPDPMSTRISTKGQVILPKAIRDRRDWGAGTRLLVEETPEGVLLRRVRAFAETRPGEVFGSLPRPASPVSLEDMDAAVIAAAAGARRCSRLIPTSSFARSRTTIPRSRPAPGP